MSAIVIKMSIFGAQYKNTDAGTMIIILTMEGYLGASRQDRELL